MPARSYRKATEVAYRIYSAPFANEPRSIRDASRLPSHVHSRGSSVVPVGHGKPSRSRSTVTGLIMADHLGHTTKPLGSPGKATSAYS